jgi:hypothetical protein
MAWLTNSGCERCGIHAAEVSCDACGEKMCCECTNMLDCAIKDSKGNLYLHLCDDCVKNVSMIGMDVPRPVYTGPRLVIDNTRKNDV